jgi:hypothetical protein
MLKETVIHETWENGEKIELKWCGRCQQSLPLSMFAKNKVKKDGLQERCTPCRSIYHKTDGRNTKRELLLKTRYNVNVEWYEAKLKEQNNCCAICKNKQAGNKSYAVDHCHKTEKVRGLLCDVCNRAIGMLNDDVNILQNAINYLKENNV